jgi:hypothetical protein
MVKQSNRFTDRITIALISDSVVCTKGQPGAIALFKRIAIVNISRRFDNADLILIDHL